MPIARDHHALVADLMANDPIVVTPELPVSRVAEFLADYDVGGLPVVDTTGRLLGVVSQTDLLGLLASSHLSFEAMALSAQDVMTKPAVTIRGSASLREAAQVMIEHHLARLVVVGDDTNAALGVISDSDIVRAFAR